MKTLVMSLIAVGGLALFAGCGSSGSSSSTPNCQNGMVASGNTCVYSNGVGYGQPGYGYGQTGYGYGYGAGSGAQRCYGMGGVSYQPPYCYNQFGQVAVVGY